MTISSCSGDSETASDEKGEASKALYTDKKEPADPMNNKGIGPVSSVEMGEFNQVMADEGKIIYDEKCTICHMLNKRYIGPAPAGILERRTPEWIMNMILNSEQMVAEDPIAKDLLKEFRSPMGNQSLTENEARKILEYFRTL